MLTNKNISRLLGVAAVAASFGLSVAHAQNGNASMNNTSSSASGKQSSISKGDREFMEDIAHANLAEIATGQMALEKSQNAEVKQFAQKMIDDHTKAEDELQQLADAKGVKLPNGPGMAKKTKAMTTLKPLTGETFDKQYIKHAGVGDHEGAHKLLAKVQSKAKDADLKAYADKTIKAVDEHLNMAKSMEQNMKK